ERRDTYQCRRERREERRFGARILEEVLSDDESLLLEETDPDENNERRGARGQSGRLDIEKEHARVRSLGQMTRGEQTNNCREIARITGRPFRNQVARFDHR